VLLVDDQKLVLDTTAMVLRRAGFTVLTAENGRAALAECEAHAGPIHLALVDVVMPGMSGPQLRDVLAEQFPGIRVLFMSGYTSREIAFSGVVADPQDFVNKPFRPKELVARVQAALSQPRSASV